MFLACFCNQQGNVLISDQPQIVILFSRRAAWLLEDLEEVREIVAMQSVSFIFETHSSCKGWLTVSVTRWWAGRDNATLTEPTSSHANCSKTRRLPPVGCTLCWAVIDDYCKWIVE